MSFEYQFTVNVVNFIGIIARLSAFIMAMPVFYSRNIPMKYKVFFILMMSALLMPIAPTKWASLEILRNLDLFKLVIFFMSEALLGIALAVFVRLLTEVMSIGGFLIDRSAGFAMARIVDPASGSQVTVLSGILVQVFIVIFLVFDGHHEILRLAVESFNTLAPGAFFLYDGIIEASIGLGTRMFLVAFQIAFPIFMVILLINIAMGLIARVGQDFPVLMLSFPLRIGVSLLMLGAIFPSIIYFCRLTNKEIFVYVAYLSGIEL